MNKRGEAGVSKLYCTSMPPSIRTCPSPPAPALAAVRHVSAPVVFPSALLGAQSQVGSSHCGPGSEELLLELESLDELELLELLLDDDDEPEDEEGDEDELLRSEDEPLDEGEEEPKLLDEPAMLLVLPELLDNEPTISKS